MRKAILVLVLLLLSTPALASEVGGFRGSKLSSTANGLLFTSNEYSATLSIGLNGRQVDFDKIETRLDYSKNRFKWGHTFKIPQAWLNAGLIKNITFSLSGGVQIGSGVYAFKWSDDIYDLWQFGDLFTAAANAGLAINETTNGFMIWNFSPSTNGTIVLDPTISEFYTNLAQGAFNNTQSNADSKAIYGLYDSAADSFVSNGTYWSRVLVLNRTGSSTIANLSWLWFEAAGMNLTDNAWLSLHFENDSKDSTRLNNTLIKNSTASSQPSFDSNCMVGGCYSFDGNDELLKQGTFGVGTNFTDGFSIMAWVRPNASRDQNSSVASKLEKSLYRGWSFDVINYSGIAGVRFVIGNGTFRTDVLSPPSFTNQFNSWTHIAATWNTTGVCQIYVNGTRVATNTSCTSTVMHGNVALSVGTNSFLRGTTKYVGEIDELHAFNRSLSDLELTQIFNTESTHQQAHNFTNVSMALRTKNYEFNDTSLECWWDLGDSNDNETLTNVTLDLSGGTRRGTLYNTTVATNCVIGNCLSFGGNNSFIRIASAPNFLNIFSVSVSVWVNPTAAGLVGTAHVFNHTSYAIRLVDGYPIFTGTDPSAGVFPVNASVRLTANTWNHIVGTYDKITRNQSIYLNGVYAAGSTANEFGFATTASMSMSIGSGTRAGQSPFNGLIDDVKVWSRCLNGTEVAALYNSGNPTNASGQENNWTAWSPEYSGGYAAGILATGMIAQYRATFNGTPNYSAFLYNTTLYYAEPITPVPPIPYAQITNFQCNNSDYLVNRSGELIILNNSGLQCQITIYDSTNRAIVNYVNMSELAFGFYNFSINFSQVGIYTAIANCSNGFNQTKVFKVQASCIDELAFCMLAFAGNSQQTFKNPPTLSNSMLGFIITFGLISLVLFFFYYRMSREHKERNTLDPKAIVSYADKFYKYTFLSLGILSFLLMFAFSWVGDASSSTTGSVSISYVNYTAAIGASSVVLPMASTVNATTSQPIPESVTRMAEAGFTLFSYVGMAIAGIFIIATIARWLAAISEKFKRRQIGDFGDE